tara:strand:+ start:3539 stop:4366 length:828 start_codon:yes stop_codon:yes gene_type:complete
MKKILVIAKNSFLAKQINDFFANSEYSLYFTTRKDFDATSPSQVRSYFINKYYDVVINCAINGGIRGRKDTLTDFINNIAMFNNLLDNKSHYGKLINFGSGAEFDRRHGIDECKEDEVFTKTPVDYYGMSKNIITKEIYSQNEVFNIRIFGCFGPHEKQSRFLKSNINNVLANKDIIIHQNKYMDFISADDLCRIIKYYIDNDAKLLPKDINAVYDTKYTLKQFAEMLKLYMNSESSIVVNKEGLSNSYTGCGKRLKQMGIPLNGLELEIKNILK